MALTGLLEKYLLVTLYNTGDMAVTIEMQNTGDSRARSEILAGIEHRLSDVAGQWRVSIVGSRANDNWEMKVEGPRGFERLLQLALRGRLRRQPWFLRPTQLASLSSPADHR